MATLTVTIQESITLNGSERGSTNAIDISGVTQLDNRIVKVNTVEQSLILFDTAEGAGQFADSSVQYVRITNLDLSNFVTLRMTAADDEYFVKLSAGDSFVLFETVMDTDDDAGAATASLANIDSIKGVANSAACNVELFIAA
tara:strand:+ start:24 stop:452 length:429 start_codon:yes stop_codon:yes gene_type:complete